VRPDFPPSAGIAESGAGGSAGGGLAAGTALLARDRAFPHLSHQILVCPMLDDRFETRSSRMLDGEGVWDRNANLFGWPALLGERRGGPEVSPYAAPARAQDLTGLPRTYIDTGSAEVFRDEILDYATRLSQAGVNVDLHMWGGAFHGFDMMAGHAAISRASIATRDEFMSPARGRTAQAMTTHPWIIDTLQAALDQTSLRQAANTLHVHHSTLQERLAWVEARLDIALARPGGRQRAAVALVLWRIAHSEDPEPAA
jgi:acetyl esterase/lipase